MPSERQLALYQQLFVNRRGAYALQQADGSYSARRAPLRAGHLEAHLAGRLTLGLYALDAWGTTRWTALDADGEDGLARLQLVWSRLRAYALPSYLEASRRGGHLWTLFAEPLSGRAARRLIAGVAGDLTDLELFPKQDRLTTVGLGSLVRAPLGLHQLTGQRYPFLEPVSGEPVGETMEENLAYLQEMRPVHTAHAADVLAVLLDEERGRHRAAARPARPAPPASNRQRSPIERAKERLGDPNTFINRFTTLNAAGRGPCPLHPPDRHPSFVVDKQTGRWTCFHEYDRERGAYLGGDALDLYMQLNKLSYQDALRELGIVQDRPARMTNGMGAGPAAPAVARPRQPDHSP